MSFKFIDAISKEEAAANIAIKKLSELEGLIGNAKAAPLQKTAYQTCKNLIKNSPLFGSGVFGFGLRSDRASHSLAEMVNVFAGFKTNQLEHQRQVKAPLCDSIFGGFYDKIVETEISNGDGVVSTEDIQLAISSFVTNFSIDFSGDDKITEEGLIECWNFLNKQPRENLGEMLFGYRLGKHDRYLTAQEKTEALILFVMMLGYRTVTFKSIRVGDQGQEPYPAFTPPGPTDYTIHSESAGIENKKSNNIFIRDFRPTPMSSFFQKELYEFRCDGVYEGLKHVEGSLLFERFRSKVNSLESFRVDFCYFGLLNSAIKSILDMSSLGDIENGDFSSVASELDTKSKKLYRHSPQPMITTFPQTPMAQPMQQYSPERFNSFMSTKGYGPSSI